MKHLKLLLVIIGVMMLANEPAAAAEYDLHQAVLDNNLQLVKRLLSKGAAINNIGSRKYGYGSALHLAVREGHVDIAQVLIDRGAEVDVLDPDDFTPLHNAAWNGNLEMAELLLAAGADISASTYDGDTPLSLAQNNDQVQIAEFIQAKLLTSPVVDIKVESIPINDSGIIDISGTYVADLSGDPKLIEYILHGVKQEDKPEIVMVQNGDQITVTVDGATGIYGALDGNTVNMKWEDARAKMIVKPGGKELVGTVVYTGGDNVRGNAELKLTRIEITPPPSLTGTYVADISGSFPLLRSLLKNPKSQGKREFKLIQNGDQITVTFDEGRGKIFGVIEGDTIKFEWHGLHWGRGIWTIKPETNEIVGEFESRAAPCSTCGTGKLNLTRIDAEPPQVVDVSGIDSTKISGDLENDISPVLGIWISRAQLTQGGHVDFPLNITEDLTAKYQAISSGEIFFHEIDGRGKLEGYWVENSGQIKNRCSTEKQGSRFWGVIIFKFTDDFNAFNGTWDYCGKGKNYFWNGKR